MRKLLLGMTLSVALAAASAVPALAADPSPGGGPAFGRHIASMAPEHPRDGGATFGACVSAMARGEVCPHHY